MSMSDTPFTATSLERRYAFLDDCPETLLQETITLPVGTLADRVAGVRRWRDALLAGRLPPANGWPPEPIARPVRQALLDLGLVRFLKDQPELVDALMRDVLSALTHQADALAAEVAARLAELERLERVRLECEETERAQRERRHAREVRLDEAARRRLREQAERAAASSQRSADADLVSAWGERARAWSEVSEVFGDLGELLGRGWDLCRGVLKQTGWLDVVRLRALLEKLPQLREIVRSLGRLQVSQHEKPETERFLIPVLRLEEERHEIRTPHVPAETRGVERSGEISRMLPVEASLLGHPKLRLLWHARRAERALLTYRVEGVEIERTWAERERLEEVERERPRPERGPILAVIDTSGSMHGLPERVAKAVVLEALRVAHAERRRCYLYAYSGPGEVLEHELDLSEAGVGRLLAFLGHSFGNGTDVGAMTTVVGRLQQEGWQKADVVLVSDGEWAASGAVVAAVQRAREAGTRFHGVQIGSRGRTGLHQLCEPVHVFQDWAQAGGWR